VLPSSREPSYLGWRRRRKRLTDDDLAGVRGPELTGWDWHNGADLAAVSTPGHDGVDAPTDVPLGDALDQLFARDLDFLCSPL
jgi:hypothetical protein